MKKIKLDLDDLKVESFDTTPEDREREQGTVFGYFTCPTICSCVDTCENTCDDTCMGPTCNIVCSTAIC